MTKNRLDHDTNQLLSVWLGVRAIATELAWEKQIEYVAYAEEVR